MFTRTRLFYAPLILALLFACGRDDGMGPDPDPGPDPEPPVATSIEVRPAAAALAAIGDTVRLQAEVRDQHGDVMANAAPARSSLDAAVATVSAMGRVQAVGEGAARIVAAAGGLADTALITVAQVAAAVEVSPLAVSLARGDTLAASVRDSNGVPIAGAPVAWSSADEAVATVEGTGVVTATMRGATQITATSGGASGSAPVTVLDQLLFVSRRDGTPNERRRQRADQPDERRNDRRRLRARLVAGWDADRLPHHPHARL